MNSLKAIGVTGPPHVVLVGCLAAAGAAARLYAASSRSVDIALVVPTSEKSSDFPDTTKPISILELVCTANDYNTPPASDEFITDRRQQTHPNEPFYRKIRGRGRRYW